MKLLKRIVGMVLAIIMLLVFYTARSNANDYSMPSDTSSLTTTQVLQLELINRLNTIVGSDSIAEAIVIGCMNHAHDYLKCMRDTMGVANAESGLFKKISKKNNAFGIMSKQCGKKGWENTTCWYEPKAYSSIEESVIDFVKLYEKNKWYNRITGQDWLEGNYCTSQCTTWNSAFSAGAAEFDLSLV